jgi:Di-haem oxidoreductase, putative peroxidase
VRLALFMMVSAAVPSYAMAASVEPIKDADHAVGYFGELLPSLTAEQRSSADSGFRLFVRAWREGDGSARNADSCVACHNVPMPGGSGTSEQARVAIDARFSPGTKQEIAQQHGGPPKTYAHGLIRRTPALFGIGFIEHASPSGTGRLGAFGQVDDLKSFVAQAFAVELGVSSRASCARGATVEDYPSACAAQLTDTDLDDVVNYLRFLAPPPRKAISEHARQLFDSVGCSACHVPTLTTTIDAPEPIRARRFAAFTDLQVHDMGRRAQLRTAPLWGLNSFGPPYMHDACAQSIPEAIACHAGEASSAASRFAALPSKDREALVRFLSDL